LDTSEIRRDIEAGCEVARAHGLSPVDHCCCGNFGRVEILQTASEKLGRPELREAALRQTARLLEIARTEGGFACFGSLSRVLLSPGFFGGISGIGYTLLRLAYPGKLPSVLAFDSHHHSPRF
ncbi:MAG TPA: lanthionine synthetase LanC family protein, partial [Verrucomicrobiae bacterium]|nr:lanthionine synthetase LanC family protein [Verrucomicrobiae bacterium]